GFETNRNIGFGEVFRKPMLHIPPVITSGSKVTVFYKSAAMEATASGVAVEDGIEGSEIRVRNDNSNKVITGRVVGPGMVQVGR
ncbi:MAG: flagellar basal body P-ring formation protein FlgA, partial [Bdellovibrionales bacterium]|nr:flagellar basal body P-ring formation protein FlgA [Bdellovibrionales bacterium]